MLKEIGTAKYLTRLSNEQWKTENEKFEGMSVLLSDEKQTIIGYECKKATIKLKDGSIYYAYYTSSIIPLTTENLINSKIFRDLCWNLRRPATQSPKNSIYSLVSEFEPRSSF